eukprot:TRINITY_DN69507_c0_g1_i1.p1 TRINITY_DN69507_c0_g1~~TRINITY_DN69507_c0_g1_i1.p1  ORF type:complete len:264 (+),score=31.26 TRINITY_DN69507_c0_g1_i1:82-873(+)
MTSSSDAASATGSSIPDTVRAIIDECDSLHSASRYADELARLETLAKEAAPASSAESTSVTAISTALHPELQWRLARAYYSSAEEIPEREARRAVFDRGLEVARAAVTAAPNVAGAHKWVAILTSKVGDYLGTKEKIQNAFLIRDHITKAIELAPTDGTAHHVLGMWCFNVANVSWIERKVASAVFAAPPEATYDDAIQHLTRADQCSEGFVLNMLALGDCFMAKKDKASARPWFEKAAAQKGASEADRRAIADAQAKLAKLG